VASLLPLQNFYSILIRLLEPSSSKAAETWVRNMAAEFCLQSIFFTLVKFFIHAVNLRYGTDDIISPPKEVVPRIFVTLKNPSSSAGFEPANLESSGKHATTRSSRATIYIYIYIYIYTHTHICRMFTTGRQYISGDSGGNFE
jgi:hypothetical protein